MKERPILFSTPMVQAILEGRKTMTRRIVKFPKDYTGQLITDNSPFGLKYSTGPETMERMACPYGQPGDRLWVKETFTLRTHNFPTGWLYEYRATAEQDGTPTDGPWKSPRFMPKAAARIWLEITAVRVEMLQEINDEESLLEGVERIGSRYVDYCNNNDSLFFLKDSFLSLWESINGPGSWEANPWVWVIEFKRIQP